MNADYHENNKKIQLDSIIICRQGGRVPPQTTPCGFTPFRVKRGTRQSVQSWKDGGKPKVFRQIA
jgi:hypothetical protein